MSTLTTHISADEQRSGAIAWLAVIPAGAIFAVCCAVGGLLLGAFVSACLVTACVAVACWWDQALQEAREGGAIE